jgi:3-oxoacyl-(acyl-carrier-protein) synthase/acyl carrier protein
VYRAVIEVVAEQTGLAAVDVDGRRSFRDLGVDSHAAVEALRKLEARLGRRLYPTLLFEFKTPEDLAAHLAASPPAAPRGPEPAPVGLGDPVPAAAPRSGTEAVAAVAIGCGPAAAPERAADGRDVAIIGMACRLPGADDAEAFWDLLVSGRTVVGEAPPERFPASSYFARGATDPHLSYSKWGGFITEPYAFDAMFFGVSPREAVCMDPQQRVFLEVAWHAMQRAGYARERPADLGVFVGAEANCYAEHFINYQRFEVIRRALARSGWWPELSARASTELLQILERELAPAEITSDVAAGNGLNQIAARVSHFLDAHGPSLVLNSACSSSLVALHYACEALRRGEVSMAVAGGVSLNIGTTSSVFLSRVQALSPTGECRPFDRRANGMALGEGAAALVLKTLARARADRDHIHAVIKGSSVSNDGHSSGITVPTAAGQAAAVRRAYEISGVEPAAVSYIECHGTATPLGDPIEVQGLALSIGASRDASSPCLIGSVKGAIGHMLGAAGVPSVMKVSLALERRILPPSVGYEDPSPHIDFGTRFAVAGGEARPWASAAPRRAGVNAFGFGGTNCHVVLEEHVPEPGPDPRRTGAELLVLYGRTPAALREVARRFGSALARHPDLDLASISRSAYRSQRPLAHLAAMAVLDRADLAAKLEALVAERRAEGLHLGRVNARRASRVVLLLGTEWLPSAEDAAALAMGSRRLAALAVPQGASRPEIGGPDRSLFPLYACARILLELGLVCDAVVGDGTAAQVAARLQADLGLLDRADSAAHELTPDRLAGRAEPTVVLGLGATPSMLSELGLAGEAVLATAIPPGAARRWAMDLLAQVAARGAPQRMDRSAEDAVWHVPLCEYPFERTRYQAFDPAALRASADPGAATPGRRNGEDIPRRTP